MIIVGVRECVERGFKCSRYLGLFDCLIVHFWFHEFELTVEFVVNNDGSLTSLIVEGPIFYGPGNYAQVRVEVHTRYSSIYGNAMINHSDSILIRIMCRGNRRELFIRYVNEDFVNNPCKYSGEVSRVANKPNDDITLRLINEIMSRMGIMNFLGQLNEIPTC
jgi:hypothetical protein